MVKRPEIRRTQVGPVARIEDRGKLGQTEKSFSESSATLSGILKASH